MKENTGQDNINLKEIDIEIGNNYPKNSSTEVTAPDSKNIVPGISSCTILALNQTSSDSFVGCAVRICVCLRSQH
jgi:hypothetical protein